MPLRELADPAVFREEWWGEEEMARTIYFFELEDETIWGATAHILVDLLSVALGAGRVNGRGERAARRRPSGRGWSEVRPPVLEEGPYTLRLPRTEDVSWIFHACQDEAIQRFTLVPVPYLPSHAVGYVTAAEECCAAGTALHFVVALTESGELLGAASLGLTTRGDGAGELGYWVERDARRQGVARRAIAALERFARERGGPAGAGGADPDRQRGIPRRSSRRAATPCSATARSSRRAVPRSATARCWPSTEAAPRPPRRGGARCVRPPTQNRSAERPSSTVRVNSAAPLALAAATRASVGLVAADGGEADEVERVRGDELEAVVGGHPAGQLVRSSATWRRIIAWVGADAVEAQHEPQLEGPEAPAEGDLPVAVVDDGARLAGRRCAGTRAGSTARRAARPGRPPRTGRSRS